MEKTKKYHLPIIFFIILSVIFLSAIIISILSNTIGFIRNESYLKIIHSISIFDFISLLLLVIGEAISLSFDKTATYNTLIATIALLISQMFSSDALSTFSFIGAEINETSNIVFFILNNLFVLIFCFFIFKFYQKDYSLRSYDKIHYITLGFLFSIFTLFTIFQIFFASIIVLSIEAGYIILFNIKYFTKFVKKDNSTPGIICVALTSFAAISAILNFFHVSHGFEYSSFGFGSYIYLECFLGYIFIYLNFLIEKTRETYAFKELEKQNQNNQIKLKVTCFQAFDCYLDDKLLVFPSKKAKELFAILVILEGKNLSMDKAITYLYPEKDLDLAKISYRDAVWKLRKYLNSLGFAGVLFSRGQTSIDPATIDCDYYNILKNKQKYHGEPLMPEYDWSIDFENLL